MLRSLHFILGSASSPLHQCRPRCLASLPTITQLSRLRPAQSVLALSPTRRRGGFRGFRMAAGNSEVNTDAAPPVVAPKPKDIFCQNCGSLTKQVIPDGEEKLRAVCTHCGRIHYENPKMVVGCLVEHNEKVLLCKRKIQPSYGLWTLPAGYLEIGESAAEGAARETLEEACAVVEIISPFAQLDIPRIGQVSEHTSQETFYILSSNFYEAIFISFPMSHAVQSYIIFLAKLKEPHFSPGIESLECALFSLDDIPFDSLAFSSIYVTLKMYIEDIKAGKLNFHYCTINKRPGASLSDPQGFDVDNHLRS